jgi:hypothetical protein
MSASRIGPGTWDALQSNGFRATFHIDDVRNGTFGGTASHSNGKVRGHGEGIVEGNRFHFRVEWNNGTVGVYNGTFGLDGVLTGITFDEARPSSQATWRSNTAF